ncbi:MAG: tetratricopeptide repeat protein [Bacteroidetes bacterium]|jgi:tetratricopeptide (TPR) repeat protein|nr:tetratricopeptide repeat protein [Bacteroidota bacterium]
MKRRLINGALMLLVAGTAAAQPQLRDGMDLLGQRKYREAANFFRQTITLYPRDVPSWVYLGKSYLGTNQFDSAEVAGRKALALDDENIDAYATLSEALIRQKKLADANLALRQGLKERKDHPDLLLQLGYLQLASDSADAALVTFTRAREISPNAAKPYEGMGDAYSRQGVSPMAVQQYERSLDVDSLQPELLSKLADLHLKDRRYNEAADVLRRLIALDPSNQKDRFKLFRLYFRANQFVNASRVGKEFVAKNPNDLDAARMYLEALYRSRQYKDVPAFADRILKAEPAYAEAKRFKAHAHFELKEYQQSVDQYVAIEGDTSLKADDFRRLGRAYQELDKDVEAVAAYERSLALDSTQSLVLNEAGVIYMTLKRWDDAARMFERRWQVDTTAVGAYINYAQCMLVTEQFDKAASALKQAIDRNPDYVPAYTNLGIAQLQMKTYDDARATFEKVIKVIDTAVVRYKRDLAQAHRYIGLTLLLDKKWQEAIDHLKQSLELEPKDENTLLWLAQGLQNANKPEEAIKYYKEVLKINKNNEQAKKGLEVLEGK